MDLQKVGGGCRIEVNDCPSKDASAESIDDSRDWAFRFAHQEEDEDSSQGDAREDASKHGSHQIWRRGRGCQIVGSCDKAVSADGVEEGKGRCGSGGESISTAICNDE